MTKEDFINKEVAIWGEDYIFDLLDRGYDIKLTTEGWKWIAPVNINYRASCSLVGNSRA